MGIEILYGKVEGEGPWHVRWDWRWGDGDMMVARGDVLDALRIVSLYFVEGVEGLWDGGRGSWE